MIRYLDSQGSKLLIQGHAGLGCVLSDGCALSRLGFCIREFCRRIDAADPGRLNAVVNQSTAG